MFRRIKKSVAYVLAVVICLSANLSYLSDTAFAASEQELMQDSIFLKQNTAITCTLSSAAMMLRRTAICADYAGWKDITEESIKAEGWVEGVGLRWKFTVFGMSVDHAYFTAANKKQQLIDLLETYPQGFVIYNSGSQGQSHAVFLCDYDAEKDVFYAADPANNVAAGRMPLSQTSMAGSTQEAQINNLDACWFVTSPSVTVKNNEYTAENIVSSNEYNPDKDIAKFNESQQPIGEYFVVTSTVSTVMRYYPSGNSSVAANVSTGDLLYVECSGNNNYGAKWYKTSGGYYIFSTNLIPLSEYSEDIGKFNNTASENSGTYTAASVSGETVAVRVDATEGNNIVAHIENGIRLYVTHSGYNSAGALWLKTEDGYYVKASEMEFESKAKTENSDFNTQIGSLSGKYSAEPVEDVHYNGDAQLYKVTASALNVRKSAVDGEIVGTLKNGEYVEVLDVADGWCKILYNNSYAWVSMKYLVLVADAQNSATSAVTIDKSIIHTGEKITCTVESEGASQYKYSVYDSSGNVVYSTDDFVIKKSFSFIPDNAGEYYFGVQLRNNDASTAYIFSANFIAYEKLVLSSVTSNANGAVYVDQPINWSVKAAAVSDDAVYSYKLYFNGEVVKTAESSVSAFSYTPGKAGVYTLEVQLKDSHSSSGILKNEVEVVNTVSIDSFELSTHTAKTGAIVHCTASVSGGTGEAEFAFYVYKNGDTVMNTEYSAKSSASFTFDAAGEYSIYCFVKGEAGNVISKSLELTVTDNMLGDVDGDGNITASDARRALRCAAQLETLEGSARIAADATKDGEITSADARLILRCAANLEKIS
ncbi:MAG: SH3 domain-containing protein [Clostridia bacterium]|nr:SH3 domain-containing protein [Clostridia bacterium]